MNMIYLKHKVGQIYGDKRLRSIPSCKMYNLNFLENLMFCRNYHTPVNFNVVAGDHNIATNEGTETAHYIAQIIRHENYQYGINDYDIGKLSFLVIFLHTYNISYTTLCVCLSLRKV